MGDRLRGWRRPTRHPETGWGGMPGTAGWGISWTTCVHRQQMVDSRKGRYRGLEGKELGWPSCRDWPSRCPLDLNRARPAMLLGNIPTSS